MGTWADEDRPTGSPLSALPPDRAPASSGDLTSSSGHLFLDGHYQSQRITLSRRMADAVHALGHDGSTVYRSHGQLVLRADDPQAFLNAVSLYRGPWSFPLRDVAVKVRLMCETHRGPIR